MLAMSDAELSRFDALMRVERGELRVDDAAGLLSSKRRQVFQRLDRRRTDGAEGLVSRNLRRRYGMDPTVLFGSECNRSEHICYYFHQRTARYLAMGEDELRRSFAIFRVKSTPSKRANVECRRVC